MADADSIAIPPRVKDLTGQVFGRLTVLEYVGNNKHGNAMWLCRCECGKERIAVGKSLRRGKTTKCKKCHSRKHGMTKSAEYATWACMLHRCSNPNYIQWDLYGGRGITVCERWRDFQNFFEDMGAKPGGKTLDRIDNDGNYEPGNCRWATMAEQNRNKRDTVMLTYNARTLCLADWCNETGLSRATISARLKRGWTIEDAITTPVAHRSPTQSRAAITHNGETRSLREWSEHLGTRYNTLLCRIRSGWPIYRVLSEPVHY